MRGEQGPDSAPECAGPDPDGPDEGWEDLAGVDEDAAEAADDGGLSHQGQPRWKACSVHELSWSKTKANSIFRIKPNKTFWSQNKIQVALVICGLSSANFIIHI